MNKYFSHIHWFNLYLNLEKSLMATHHWTKLIKLRRVKDTTTAQDTQLQTVTFKWWVVGGQSLQLTCRKNSMKFKCTIKNVGQTDEPGEEEWDWSVSVERHHNPGQTKSQTGVRLFKDCLKSENRQIFMHLEETFCNSLCCETSWA